MEVIETGIVALIVLFSVFYTGQRAWKTRMARPSAGKHAE
jgi:hypothetical protein